MKLLCNDYRSSQYSKMVSNFVCSCMHVSGKIRSPDQVAFVPEGTVTAVKALKLS